MRQHAIRFDRHEQLTIVELLDWIGEFTHGKVSLQNMEITVQCLCPHTDCNPEGIITTTDAYKYGSKLPVAERQDLLDRQNSPS